MDAIAYTLHNIRDFISLIRECNTILREKRHPEMPIEWKTDERGRRSPTTQGDILVNNKICEFIARINRLMLRNGYRYVIVAEENSPESMEARFDSDIDGIWYVDGLDGTSDYIDFENPDATFTCGNIGLVVRERDSNGQLSGFQPVFGIFSDTMRDHIYWGHKFAGSFSVSATGVESRLLMRNLTRGSDFKERRGYRVAISGKHGNKATTDFLNATFKYGYKTLSGGSSVKVVMVTDGRVDMYPRLGPTMEWDICAAHAVHRFAGGRIVEYDPLLMPSPEKMQELKYNKPSLYNPHFLVI
jgi:3'(2'), 5'-bisphosphate nucleotidase